jgi:hypothetical protein
MLIKNLFYLWKVSPPSHKFTDILASSVESGRKLSVLHIRVRYLKDNVTLGRLKRKCIREMFFLYCSRIIIILANHRLSTYYDMTPESRNSGARVDVHC